MVGVFYVYVSRAFLQATSIIVRRNWCRQWTRRIRLSNGLDMTKSIIRERWADFSFFFFLDKVLFSKSLVLRQIKIKTHFPI